MDLASLPLLHYPPAKLNQWLLAKSAASDPSLSLECPSKALSPVLAATARRLTCAVHLFENVLWSPPNNLLLLRLSVHSSALPISTRPPSGQGLGLGPAVGASRHNQGRYWLVYHKWRVLPLYLRELTQATSSKSGHHCSWWCL